MLQVISRLQNRRVHLLHCVTQFHPKSTKDIPLPRVILGIDPRLHLLIVNDTYAKRLLSVGRIERRPGLLDLGQQLLPIRQRVAKSIEHVFGLEVP